MLRSTLAVALAAEEGLQRVDLLITLCHGHVSAVAHGGGQHTQGERTEVGEDVVVHVT